MNQNINTTQNIELEVSPLEFRLDILRLTFTIEEMVENFIKNIFTKNRIPVEEFKNMLANQQAWEEFINWYNHPKNKENKSKVINNNKDGEFINITNLINTNTFGGLLSLLEKIKFQLFMNQFWSHFGQFEWKVFRAWLEYIKNIRNLLAHRTNINPSTFWEKIQFPAQSEALGTKNLSSLELKKYIFTYFIPEQKRNSKINSVFNKHF